MISQKFTIVLVLRISRKRKAPLKETFKTNLELETIFSLDLHLADF